MVCRQKDKDGKITDKRPAPRCRPFAVILSYEQSYSRPRKHNAIVRQTLKNIMRCLSVRRLSINKTRKLHKQKKNRDKTPCPGFVQKFWVHLFVRRPIWYPPFLTNWNFVVCSLLARRNFAVIMDFSSWNFDHTHIVSDRKNGGSTLAHSSDIDCLQLQCVQFLFHPTWLSEPGGVFICKPFKMSRNPCLLYGDRHQCFSGTSGKVSW